MRKLQANDPFSQQTTDNNHNRGQSDPHVSFLLGLVKDIMVSSSHYRIHTEHLFAKCNFIIVTDVHTPRTLKEGTGCLFDHCSTLLA